MKGWDHEDWCATREDDPDGSCDCYAELDAIDESLDDLAKIAPRLAGVIAWARCGISEHSGDMLTDRRKLLEDLEWVHGRIRES